MYLDRLEGMNSDYSVLAERECSPACQPLLYSQEKDIECVSHRRHREDSGEQGTYVEDLLSLEDKISNTAIAREHPRHDRDDQRDTKRLAHPDEDEWQRCGKADFKLGLKPGELKRLSGLPHRFRDAPRPGKRIQQDRKAGGKDDDGDLEAVRDTEIQDEQRKQRCDRDLAEEFDRRLGGTPDDADPAHEKSKHDPDGRGDGETDRRDPHRVAKRDKKVAVRYLLDPGRIDIAEGRKLRHRIARGHDLPNDEEDGNDRPSERAAGEVTPDERNRSAWKREVGSFCHGWHRLPKNF